MKKQQGIVQMFLISLYIMMMMMMMMMMIWLFYVSSDTIPVMSRR